MKIGIAITILLLFIAYNVLRGKGKCIDCNGKGTFSVGGVKFKCSKCQGTGKA